MRRNPVRAVQVVRWDGPSAVEVRDVPEPQQRGDQVLIDVRAAGVNFPDVLQTKGLYQYKPERPYTLGAEVAGVVREAPPRSGVQPGDRVVAFTSVGGFAEVVAVPVDHVLPLPDEISFNAGACLPMNYLTAHFVLETRCHLAEGETVLVHGAAGGVGTAALPVAKGLGARTIAVVSTDDKEQVARDAGADEVVRSDGSWKDEAKELSGGGVDVVIDPVGGDRFLDSLRSLGEGGRLVVIGFTGGSIPEVKVNRLLLNNTEVVGAGWGAYVMPKPDLNRQIGAAVNRLVDEGFVRPIVGARFEPEEAADALKLIDERGATGKVVLKFRD
jgi:NADPH:quinone reductase